MLLLGRKLNEKIRIGDDIVITVTRLSRERVSLGIEAPRDIPVHRQEIYDLIHTMERETSYAIPTEHITLTLPLPPPADGQTLSQPAD